jgi:hypothetical protein
MSLSYIQNPTNIINKGIEGVLPSVGKKKLNFRYHNPNTDEETLKFLTKVFAEASRVKFENVLQETVVPINSIENVISGTAVTAIPEYS